MSARIAEKCFSENRNLFSNPQGTSEQQEKFNLYNGLANLADAVQQLERELDQIKRNMR